MNAQLLHGGLIVIWLFIVTPALISEVAFRRINDYSLRHWHRRHTWEE
jgi:hypothetical protein